MAKEKTVKVELGNRSYNIFVGDGLISSAGERIKEVISGKRVIVITDLNVADAGHLETMEISLKKADIEHESVILPPGEQTKSFEELEKLLNQLLSLKPGRDTTLVALGGGVIGDLTGFAASILLRGVDFVQVPTTLLAMVDSSVGGKTGINTEHGKNLIGSFYQPKLVIADPDLLNTLPERELLAGYAEVVKYALIGDKEFFNILTKSTPGKYDPTHAMNAIEKSCIVKAKIVSADEKESGQRALLNLGHTFGHALEAETGYSDKLLHGEAVSIGMVLAFKFSKKLGLCPPGDVARVEKHLSSVGLPISPLDVKHTKFSAAKLLAHIKHDKKIKDGKMVLILVRGIGQAFIQKDVDSELLLEFLETIV